MMEDWDMTPVPIKGFEGYFITDDGRVLSSRRPGMGNKTLNAELHELRQSLAGRGYCKVTLSIGAEPAYRFVHHLIAETFHGPRPPGHEACHKDGNKLNNSATNIYWGTKAENASDSIRHGSTTKGERNARAKLCDEDVRQIRSLGGSMTLQQIAKRFGVSLSAIHFITTGKTWTHVNQ